MKYIFTTLFIMGISLSYAQNTNWASLTDYYTGNTYVNFGYDFGVTTQIGYGKKIDAVKPILLSVDFSAPQGKDRLDDFKVRLGGQAPIYDTGNFKLTAKVYSNFRRHQTRYVRMLSFGSEISALFGYYKPKWYLSFELGFDKSIVNQLKHTDAMRDNFPEISDGWFIPSGGHFFYGIQGSRNLGERLEFTYRIGATKAQFNDEDALLPVYFQLGFTYKFFQKGDN